MHACMAECILLVNFYKSEPQAVIDLVVMLPVVSVTLLRERNQH